MLPKILLPLAMLGMATACSPGTPAEVLSAGSTAPNFSVDQWYNFEGRSTLASLKGKVVLLDFWRTW